MISSELSDYVNEFQNGNKKVFEQIYNSTNNQLFNVLYSFVKDEELSYDLMQDTYITFCTKADTIKMPEYTQKWLNIVAINKAKRYLQTKKKDILVSEENEYIFENQEELDQEFLPEEILDNKEKQKIIKDIIDNLSLEQKTAVYLYYFNEMSLSEVAEEMQCSEGTIKSRLNYARKKIKLEVDSWEKKGTKLYGTGIPVLVLLLKSQIQEANAMSLDRAKDILNNINSSNIGTSSIFNMKNINKGLSSKIITSCVAGGITVSIMAGYFIYNHKQDNLADTNNQEITTIAEKTKEKSTSTPIADSEVSDIDVDEEEQDCSVYWTYAELGIDKVTSLTVSDANVIQAFDFKNDRCIGADINSDIDSDSAYITVNGKQINLFFDNDIWNEEARDDNGKRCLYISFRELGQGNIEALSVSDSSVVDATINKEEKYVLIQHKGIEGSATITTTNDKGENATIEVKCNQDSDGKIYFSKEFITCA
ncbi:sigma-70 family RNA polymerase sigma factor [Clostridium butyricum]|jgi:RNA polymerase sigma factor (sigma-70 family)|uniref:Sigma-70 family RNA polymerase sigma factor n=1 Tax=Clostridium butyricum TaxID=1492 RepID=A0A6L9EQW1_CLOBU|nr:sigma-70 family RNA polymerase sigma factor [Clostridium butyricum]